LESGKGGKAARYDGSVGNTSDTLKNLNLTHPVATLRSEFGNVGAKYDGSAGQNLNTLRPQFGKFSDAN
jgi:hypothetical protein